MRSVLLTASVLVFAFGAMSWTPAAAQTGDDSEVQVYIRQIDEFKSSCGDESLAPNAQIAACTKLILIVLKSGVDGKPLLVEAFSNRGTALKRVGDIDDAIVDYTEALSLDSDFWIANYNRGISFGAKKDYPSAVADFTRAIQLAPQRSESYVGRAEMNGKLDHISQAIDDYRTAIRLTPENAEAWNGLCWELGIANGDLNEARVACEMSLGIKPGVGAVLDSSGLIGLKQGRNQDAWNDYDAAFRSDMDNAGFLYGRGIAALRLGRVNEGQADISVALKKDPDVAKTYATYGIKP